MVNFSQNGCMYAFKDIVNVKQCLDKNLTNFIRRGIQASYYTSFGSVENSMKDGLPKKKQFSNHHKCPSLSHKC